MHKVQQTKMPQGRLTVTLTLAKKAITSTNSTDFIELMRVANGEVVKKQKLQNTTDSKKQFQEEPLMSLVITHYNLSL